MFPHKLLFKKGKHINSIVEKPGEHYLNQVIKLNLTNIATNAVYMPLNNMN